VVLGAAIETTGLEPISPKRVAAVVCAGPSCEGRGRTKLCTVLLAAGLEVGASECLGICEGPVAAAVIGDRWEVIRKVDDKKRRTRLVDAVVSGQPSKIGGRIVGGSRRKKALKRAMRALV
jgi:hypothetical protein